MWYNIIWYNIIWYCITQYNLNTIKYNKLPVVPARGGAEVALGLYYKTFLIYRTCMRRAPARPVRACFVRTYCADVCSTALYYNACTKYFPVLLCTTKLAQSTSQYYFVLKLAQSISQYYFVLQSLHKALPSTTLYYKACTKYVPVLLCTKACTKHFPVLLCTTKLAQSTSQ